MRRPLLCLWRYPCADVLAVFCFAGLIAAVAFFAVLFGIDTEVIANILILPLVMFVKAFWESRSCWLWPFVKQIRRFRTVSDRRIVLHYAPELAGKLDVPAFFQRCEAELDSLAGRFGSRLRGHVAVFLFESLTHIGNIFGHGFGGRALPCANAIVIANDYSLREVLRHEFGHLFAFRWSFHAPPLLSEGLAVWLQETYGGLPIDKAARPYLDSWGFDLNSLLDPQFFFAERNRNACYVLAGSFTGFLIRRHGWERFRNLYRKCDGKRFPVKFKKCYGVTLEKAEWQWRNEIIVMEILNRRLGKNIRSRVEKPRQ